MKQKRILTILLSVAMMLSLIPANISFAAINASDFASGSGTQADPYRIATLTQLEAFRESVNGGNTYEGKYIKLTADIDMSGTYNASGKSWTPISDGSVSYYFRGKFDGCGHKITGLYIDTTGTDDSNAKGLFGYVKSGCEIKNLHVSGSLSASNNTCGGIVGNMVAGDDTAALLIENCSFSGSVIGYPTGGIVGSIYYGMIRNCYNTADVSGSTKGGIAGQVYSAYSTIKNCYNVGKITVGNGSGKYGGIAGYCGGNIIDCYDTCLGKTVGESGGNAEITDCYCVDKGIYKPYATEITEEELKTQATFENWDFDTVWIMDDERPLLRSNNEKIGTEKYPYTISSLSELEDFRDSVNNGTSYEGKYFELTADIDLMGSDDNQWTPIGKDSDTPFKGKFNGNGHEIKGLYINNTTDNNLPYQGLFGYITGAVIENLTVSGTVSGKNMTESGGIVGFAYNGSRIENCCNKANVTTEKKGENNKIGGIAGKIHSSAVIGCYNTGNISGADECVGGIAGYATYGVVIENCYNAGSVSVTNTSSNYVYRIGGIVSYMMKSDLKNSYNVGTVTVNAATEDVKYVGGAVGQVLNICTIAGVYYLDGCNGTGTTFDSTTGTAKSAADFKQQTTFSGWDFDNVWIMEDGDERPYLRNNHEENGSTIYPYTISTLEELEAFRDKVNGGNTYEGKLIILKADIDMSEKYGEDKESWTPIGTPLSGSVGTKFKGTFEGNEKTIKNIYAQGNTNQGLFRYIDFGGTIQNLNITGYVKGYVGYSGAIAAYNEGTIKSCTSSCTVETNPAGREVGGITGVCYGIVEKCVFDGTATGGCEIGGIAGEARGSAEIRNCINKGGITGTSTSSDDGVGGIAGFSQSKYIENCCNVGTITSSMSNSGGIVGDASYDVKNCYYLAGCAAEGTTLNTFGTAKTADDFSGGAVTWLLNGGNPNGVWKQTLGEDDYPGFSGGNVYSGYESCEATERSYTNDAAAAEAFHETEGHNGGTATCTALAVCDYCNEEYGEVNASNHTGTKQSIACTEDSKYNKHQWIWSCCSNVENEEDHNWNYSADDTADTITRTCNDCGKDGTVTLKIEGKTYDKTALSASCEKTGIFEGGRYNGDIKISYCCESGCKKAGKHIVTLTVGEACVSKEVTIDKKEVTLIVYGGYKEYDGTNTVEVRETSVQGVIPGDSVYVDEELIRVYTDGTAEGQYTKGYAENVKLIDTEAENYFFATENGRVTVDLDSEYDDGYFKIYKATINVKPLDQQLSSNADLDQSKYTVDGLDERFTISGVVLYEKNGYIYVKTDDIEVFLDGNDVTANFQFSAYNSANIIRMCEGHTFNGEGFCSTGACNTYQEAVKNGDYYEIGNAGQLYWFAEQVNDYNKYDINGKLTADIKVNDNPLADNARKWIPISSGAYSYYSGNFDGNGHTVSGLYCKAENNNVGFFGNLGYYSLTDLHIANSYFEGNNAGGIAGYSSSESITKCSVADDVTVKGTNAGGLVGNTSYDTIENCFSLAAVSGNVWGGLVGYNCDTIKNCYTSLMRPVGYNNKNYGGSMTDVYYAEDTNDYTTPDENDYTTDKPTFEGATEVKDFASGEVAYILQSKVVGELLEYDGDGNPVYGEPPQIWGQKIGTDKYPTFSNAKVYEDTYNDVKAYRNDIDGYKIIYVNKTDATVVLEKTGTYTIVLADYEENKLANVKTFTVTVDKAQAVRVISDDLTLGTKDKVMLWKDTNAITPLCNAYEVK